MWKWLAIAAGLGVLAFGSVLVLHSQDSGNWGDAAEHLPSGSTTRLESTPVPETPDSAANEPTSAVAPTFQPPPPAAKAPPPAPAAVQEPAPALAEVRPSPQPAPPPAQEQASPPPPVAMEPPPKTPPKPYAVNIDLAWLQEPPEGILSASAYMVVTNEGPGVDRLLSASSPDAHSVTIQQASAGGGPESAVPIRNLQFEPGIPMVFEPGGYHLTLSGLKHELARGRKVTVFLIFEKAGTVQVGVPVGDPRQDIEPSGSG